MKNAFTLIELTVAVAIMAMVLFFGSVIFKASIETHRTAGANAEIMQKLRAITDQLDRDLKGVGKGLPVVVVADTDGCSRIVFLANGDFQSVRQYGLPGSEKTVSGNLASIFYGQTEMLPDPITDKPKPEERILARGQMILTADTSLPLLEPGTLDEYCNKCLDGSFNMCFYKFRAERESIFGSKRNWAGGSLPDSAITSPEEGFVKYMAKGVSDFTVEFAESGNEFNIDNNTINWREPAGGGSFVDSEHAPLTGNEPARALKFTFTLYDSKGIMEQVREGVRKKGRTFTHIVYLGE